MTLLDGVFMVAHQRMRYGLMHIGCARFVVSVSRTLFEEYDVTYSFKRGDFVHADGAWIESDPAKVLQRLRRAVNGQVFLFRRYAKVLENGVTVSLHLASQDCDDVAGEFVRWLRCKFGEEAVVPADGAAATEPFVRFHLISRHATELAANYAPKIQIKGRDANVITLPRLGFCRSELLSDLFADEDAELSGFAQHVRPEIHTLGQLLEWRLSQLPRRTTPRKWRRLLIRVDAWLSERDIAVRQ